MSSSYYAWSAAVSFVALLAIPSQRLTVNQNIVASVALAFLVGWCCWPLFVLSAWLTRKYQ